MVAEVVLIGAMNFALRPPMVNHFAELTPYNGSWKVHTEKPLRDGTRDYTLENRCTVNNAFYACEQNVNNVAVSLVVYTLTKIPGKYDVDAILPNGHASSDTDLFIQGGTWTYVTNNASGKPVAKKVMRFDGADAVHFEQYESADEGVTWKRTNGGVQTRVHYQT